MDKNKDKNTVMKMGGIYDLSHGGSLYDKDYISPTLIAGMTHGTTIPYILEVKKIK